MSSQNSKGSMASQVCWNCKTGKRKCSKDLPSCARCSKLLLRCEYEYSSQGNDAGPQTKASSPASPAANVPSASLLWNASRLFQGLSIATSASISELDIPAQVLSILISNGEGVPGVAHTYFRTIDVWLPIISPKEFTKRLEMISAAHNTELSCLLLCMFLVTQSPSVGGTVSEMQNATYFQAKILHSAFVSTGNCKLDIIQAGVLISLYEQGHGMIEAAQLTLAACIRSATKVKVALRSATNLQNSEFGRLWWGILILDRHMNQTLPAEEIHLLLGSSRDGIPSMELPADDEAHAQLPRTISARTTSGVSVASQPTTRLGPFCRAAEASHLLGEVLGLVAYSAVSGEMDPQISQKLDGDLQKLAMTLLQQAVNGWEECCGAIGLCLSTLLLLHGRTWELVGQKPASLERRATAQMALSSSTRMVIDIALRFHMDLAFIDLPALPLPAAYCVYRATMFYIYFAGDEFLGPEWSSNLDSLKSTLGHFSKRWKVGKRYLDLIDIAFSEKRQSRAQVLLGDEDGPHRDPDRMIIERDR